MRLPLLFVFGFFISVAYAIEPYQALEGVLSKENLPRLLNTVDLKYLDTSDPEPIYFPIHDFNQDGFQDIAISGIYDLPKGTSRYFLLVAGSTEKPQKFKTLFFKEYGNPVLIHKRGTTGAGDPGDQAFSISFCVRCEKGKDFYWNKQTKKFILKPWTNQKLRIPLPSPPKEVQVPDDIVDKVFKVVGQLKDVQVYIQAVKKKGSQLGTRVTFHEKKKKNIYWVKIFEKKEGKEIPYDRILVDVKKMKVIKRKNR